MQDNETPKGGAWIPGKILNHSKLSSDCKLLYAIIFQLQHNTGYCYASNNYLSNRIGKSERTVQRLIKQLSDENIIKYRYWPDENSKSYKRLIRIKGHSKKGGDKSVVGGTTKMAHTHDKFGVISNTNVLPDKDELKKLNIDNENFENFPNSMSDILQQMNDDKVDAKDNRK